MQSPVVHYGADSSSTECVAFTKRGRETSIYLMEMYVFKLLKGESMGLYNVLSFLWGPFLVVGQGWLEFSTNIWSIYQFVQVCFTHISELWVTNLSPLFLSVSPSS